MIHIDRTPKNLRQKVFFIVLSASVSSRKKSPQIWPREGLICIF